VEENADFSRKFANIVSSIHSKAKGVALKKGNK
jgi:hypothetical protein